MLTLNLFPVNGAGNRDYERFLQESEVLFDRGNIFYTFCEYLRQKYVLVTAEPKVQLDVSQLSEWAKNYLCHLIEAEFRREDEDSCSRMLVSLSPDGNDRDKLRRFFATRSVDRDGTISFHLSAIRG